MALKRTTFSQEAAKRAGPNEISFIIHKLGFTASVESYQIISTMDSDMGQLVPEIKKLLGGGELAVFNLYLCNSTALLQNPHLFIGKPLLEDEGFAMMVEFRERDTIQETFEVVPYFNAGSNNHIVVEYYYDKPGYQQMYCSKLMPVTRVKGERMKMRQSTPRARSTPIMQATGQEPLGIPRGLTNSGAVQIPDLVNNLANLPSFETLAETECVLEKDSSYSKSTKE